MIFLPSPSSPRRSSSLVKPRSRVGSTLRSRPTLRGGTACSRKRRNATGSSTRTGAALIKLLRPLSRPVTDSVSVVSVQVSVCQEVFQLEPSSGLDQTVPNFIEPDPSPHAASVLFAPKPNTTARRFCIDYRWMNDHLKSRITPAPSLEGTAFGCREAQRFTKIDVIQAFHRLRMDPDSEYLTAFRTRFGTFRWKVLPFGLKVGPAWFQQFINAQLHDLLDRCASAYADDVLIYSDKEEDHWKDCQEVIWRLHQANLQGDIKKSRFNVTKVDYLGVLLEAGVGLSVDPRKVRSIQDWKFEDLRDRTAIRSFVGLCNFIRVFCYHASGVAEPLNRSGWRSIQFHQFGLTIELR
ncbi:reverse transcriptase (RNA-dependent DNA polymerase) [Hirsutella rhossiliensis]